MSKLKKCPCGMTPKELYINADHQRSKWATVKGDCCGEWEIEFRADHNPIDSEECMSLAIEGWNNAPRENSETDENDGQI